MRDRFDGTTYSAEPYGDGLYDPDEFWYYVSFHFLADYDDETRVSLYKNGRLYREDPGDEDGNELCGAITNGAKLVHIFCRSAFPCIFMP